MEKMKKKMHTKSLISTNPSKMGEKRQSNTLESIKSMNQATRKQEQSRIKEANIKIARKIFQIGPYTKASEQIEQFNFYKQLSENMSKV